MNNSKGVNKQGPKQALNAHVLRSEKEDEERIANNIEKMLDQLKEDFVKENRNLVPLKKHSA